MTDYERTLVLEERDGRDFELLFDRMLRRFDKPEGVPADDVERALQFEARGMKKKLNNLLQRKRA